MFASFAQIHFPRLRFLINFTQATWAQFLYRDYLLRKMVEESGVTEASLKAKLVDLLQATHVEIEDMSGTTTPLPLLRRHLTSFRRLWPSILCCYSLSSIRKEDVACEKSIG
jgi:hypothetical protein